MALGEELFKTKGSDKGQIVNPKPLRVAYHIDEGEEILMMPTEEGVLLKPVDKTTGLRGLLKEVKVDLAECESILAAAKKSLAKVA